MESEKELMKITFDKKTLDKIESVVNYENAKNDLKKNLRYSDNKIEDFITGCVNLYLNKIEQYNEIADIKNNLGEKRKLKNNFRQYMKKCKIKQKELSEITGIDQGSLSHLLNNRNQMTLDVFLRIWAALDYPPLEEVLYRE